MMKRTVKLGSSTLLLLSTFCPAAIGQPLLNVQPGVQFGWPTGLNNTYRVQWSPNPGGAWADLAVPLAGDGTTNLLYDPVPLGVRRYQVLEIVPGSPAVPGLPLNGGFESGSGITASNWVVAQA